MLGLRLHRFGSNRNHSQSVRPAVDTPKVPSATQPTSTTDIQNLSDSYPVKPTSEKAQATQTSTMTSSPLHNGMRSVATPPQSPYSAMYSKKSGFFPRTSSLQSRTASGNYGTGNASARRADHGYKIGFVQETAFSLKKKSLSELGAGVYQNIGDVSFIGFLEWIRSERLTTLPHKGSRWDRVLIKALYFAEQLHNFDAAIQGFALDSSAAAALGYGHAQLLLELGHENSEALDKAFTVFYKFSLSFSSILHRSELLAATSEIREQLCLEFADLLSLVVEVAIRFYKTVSGMTSSSASLDIFEVFSDTIESFRSRQAKITELIWNYQIESEGIDITEVLDLKTLSTWLAPPDRVLASLSRDHTTFADDQAEYTCLWFQSYLSQFIKSNAKYFSITGPSGSGKTVLAGSIADRLQRPMGRKTFDTLFFSISSGIPSQATSLAMVKSLLLQLVNLRIGNMAMYHALIHAYEHCLTASDVGLYEDYLWKALTEALQHPTEGADDLIIIVDGIDELVGTKSEQSSAVHRLLKTSTQGTRVRLITLSSSASMPSDIDGVHHSITARDIRDDIHAVALKLLAQNRGFQSQPGPEQESILDRIISISNGSFLYAILICEILCFSKAGDGISKLLQSWESSRPTVQDLVLKLVTSLEPDSNAKKLLSWILVSERPFTADELSCLFSIDPHHGTLTDRTIDIDCIIQSLRALLTINDRIVRFRHSSVHNGLQTLAQNGKLALPIKDAQTDLVLRTLTYVRNALRTPMEPEMDLIDQTLAIRLYRQHHFLEYVVRYWVIHLKKSSLAPKGSGEFKPTAELCKVFPDTTTFALLEKLTWDLQWAAPEALKWHILVGTVRRQILTENHPAVLQTYISIASCYNILSKCSEAQSYYYISIKISRTVLSETHPLTLRVAELYLEITQTLTSTTRTDIMTRREDILILLITAYEKQRGSTSDLVIRMRKLLAELYISINEKDRALEIYRIIQQLTIKQYGKNSDEARDAQGRLNVALGKRKDDCEIQTYKDTFFGDDEEEEEEIIDISNIEQIILWFRRAETYISHGEIILAERTYVELWQQVSSKCRTVHSIEWHQKNIDIATTYSHFLRSQKRVSEASAVLVSVWHQYENHQLSHSESIVTRLTSVAKELKSMSNHTMALSIFKFASSYYKSVRREESESYTEINKEISSTTTELVKQSLASSTTVTETTTTISETAFQDVFQSVITSHKTIESSTVALAKKLTVQYMEKKNYSAAITVIKTTLQRTWCSFFSGSIHDVIMTSTFLHESIELIERLAEIHLKERHFEKVEDCYARFFRAVLITSGVDRKLFEKALNLLVNYYDSHGYADNAISVYQEVLVVYRRSVGPTHAYTIQTLYILASRCRAHPRNHPYWLEYYQQIVTSLNKDSDVCHKDAMEAITIVANCYWEDRRYAEAVTVFTVLWNTFIKQTKEYKQYSDSTYVQRLYERYFQCLEETKASWETLHQATKQYRETCISVFGSEETISVEATLCLAQVTQRSEEHAMEAISLFESVSTSSKVTTTKVTEIKHALSSLYVRQISSQSSTTIKKETLQRAISMREEQFVEATSKYGYSHETTLTHLHELSTLYFRQQRTEVVVKKLTIAISEVIMKETSSQKMYESAQSIASIFLACHQEAHCVELIQELHRQICAKDTCNISKWSIDVTKSSRSALAFLASLEYALRKDLSITYAEILADITAEAIYFECFRETITKNKSVKDVILAAVSLRTYLLHRKRTTAVAFVEDQATAVFVKRDTANINVLSKDSSRIFIVGILDYLGHHQSRNFIRAVIVASNERVASLTKAGKFPEAYDVANFGFLFASGHDGYNGPKSIGQGFKLASLLVGGKGAKTPDANLRKKTLELSNRIVKKILDICKALKINFAQVQLPELSQLAALLGEQQDYATLEWLLTTLWNTRDAQRSWPSSVLITLGRRLITARYLAGHPIKAIRLCEDIAYNMRRTHGPRSPITLETYELLTQLYTSTGIDYQNKKQETLAQEYFRKSMGVHEDLLKHLARDDTDCEDSDDDDGESSFALIEQYTGSVRGRSVNGSVNGSLNDKHTEGADADCDFNRSAFAHRHFQLLKLTYQRLGCWVKPASTYERLSVDLFKAFGGESEWKGTQGVDKWTTKGFGGGKAETNEGVFTGVNEWGFASVENGTTTQTNGNGKANGNGHAAGHSH